MENDSKITFRIATEKDLNEVIQLICDDPLGSTREIYSEPLAPEYIQAFHDILADPNNELIVGELQGKVIAVLQLTVIPNLTLKGSKRGLIEGVRVASRFRGQGIGRLLFQFTLERARQRGCQLAQLTSNKSRKEAIKFYSDLGFQASHEGFKIYF